MTHADTQGHFARLAPSYTRLRGGNVFVSPLTNALVAEADLHGRRVLDIGCGTGRLLHELADRHEVRPVGIDRSPEMIDEARTLLPDAELHVGPAEAMPLPDSAGERAAMTMVAHHLNRPAAFAEAKRVLEPHGVFAVASTDPGALGAFWMAPLFPRYVEIDAARFPTADSLRADLSGAGFDSVRIAHFDLDRVFDRETALAKLRGRAYSSFAFMTDEEHADGVARAERELPETIRYTLRLLLAVGR